MLTGIYIDYDIDEEYFLFSFQPSDYRKEITDRFLLEFKMVVPDDARLFDDGIWLIDFQYAREFIKLFKKYYSEREYEFQKVQIIKSR